MNIINAYFNKTEVYEPHTLKEEATQLLTEALRNWGEDREDTSRIQIYLDNDQKAVMNTALVEKLTKSPLKKEVERLLTEEKEELFEKIGSKVNIHFYDSNSIIDRMQEELFNGIVFIAAVAITIPDLLIWNVNRTAGNISRVLIPFVPGTTNILTKLTTQTLLTKKN